MAKGYYTVPTAGKAGSLRPIPNVKSWVALSREYEPLLPRVPSAHGAQISSFMQYFEDTGPFPLFIRGRESSGYHYYGQYREPCPSDRVGWSEMARIPQYVKDSRAKGLGNIPLQGKSRKHLTALREMWPPVKIGWWIATKKIMVPYDEDLEDIYGELDVVKRLITEEEAEAITSELLLEAFNMVRYCSLACRWY